MAKPEEEAIQQSAEKPEQTEDAAIERIEISPTSYRMQLLEARWNLNTRLRGTEGLLGRLDVALENRHLRLYFFESDNNFRMITQEKGQMGFPTTHAPDPTPEGMKMISLTHFREALEDAQKKIEGQISEIEGLLTRLDKAESNRAVRIRCFQTAEGFEMETEEKGDLGFYFPKE